MGQKNEEDTGFRHVETRSAGQIALFEDDEDRRTYLRIMKRARDETGVRIVAWVLMTTHVHQVVDCGENPESLSKYMYILDKEYALYFNNKTGRTGHLFEHAFWRKPIKTESQLIATVHYIHMNPEAAGIAPMRDYRWSSYQEYAGKSWVVDTSVILGIFGSFEAFNAYSGSSDDVVRRQKHASFSDEEVLALAIECSGCSSSSELRGLLLEKRNHVVRALHSEGIGSRLIARALGIGSSTVLRILSK